MPVFFPESIGQNRSHILFIARQEVDHCHRSSSNALGVLRPELARKIDVPTNRITQILNGTRAITGDTALRLAHFFGTSAQFWSFG